jgi:hypothetical protein
MCWKPCSSCWSFYLLREEFLSAPIHSSPLSGSPYRSFTMPLKFWDDAFLTAAYLINILPSRVTNYRTPIELLLKEKPNYNSLQVFGCVCWPNLWPYNARKLMLRSIHCVFLGCSSLHKGFKYLEPSTSRVYISCDVVFDESVFPFSEMHPNAGASLRKEILLLPNHLLNAGDALPTSGVTDVHPGSSTMSVLQESTKNSVQNDVSGDPNACDHGVLILPIIGTQPQDDSVAASGGSRSQADSPAHSIASWSAAAPSASSASPRAPTSPVSPRSAPHGGRTLSTRQIHLRR